MDKLVAGPFESHDKVGAVRFSPDSKKLAVESYGRKCLKVWEVRVRKKGFGTLTIAPIWTKKGNIF